MALFKPDASKSLFIDGAFRAPTTLAAYAATDPSGSDWGSLKVPLCLSTRGLFVRREVDGYDR